VENHQIEDPPMSPSNADSAIPTDSDLRIARIEAFKLRLPYKGEIAFKSLKQSVGEYVLLRLTLDDGRMGHAETICRPEQAGEDATSIAYELEHFFAPLLKGADPLAHLGVLHRLDKIRACTTSKCLIDIAMWDLRGQILGRPVWHLLGAERPKPVPLTWIAHGNTVEAQIAEARKMHETRGYRGMKLKTWRRSAEDLRMVEGVRKAVGDDVTIYVDANGAYSETEARTIFPRMADFAVCFVEEPSDFQDPARQAAMAAALPIAMLGDQCCETLAEVNLHLRLQSVGGVSVKMRRTGMTQSLKVITLCEAAGIPALIGTDSESRLAAMPRIHLRTAIPHLDGLPTETHFFDKLGDDVFRGSFRFEDGTLTASEEPGFGVHVDDERLRKYAF
jgi:L-alanine-DL-glutamate epimerase-like enolase superfamily enzyme